MLQLLPIKLNASTVVVVVVVVAVAVQRMRINNNDHDGVDGGTVVSRSETASKTPTLTRRLYWRSIRYCNIYRSRWRLVNYAVSSTVPFQIISTHELYVKVLI